MPPDRLLPSAPDSEIALLAACVLDPASVYSLQTETTPGSFTSQPRQAIREILCDVIPAHGKDLSVG